MLQSEYTVMITFLLTLHIIIFWLSIVLVNLLIIKYDLAEPTDTKVFEGKSLVIVWVCIEVTFNLLLRLTVSWFPQIFVYMTPVAFMFFLINTWFILLIKQNLNFFHTYKYSFYILQIPLGLVQLFILVYLLTLLLLSVPDLWYLNYYQWDM